MKKTYIVIKRIIINEFVQVKGDSKQEAMKTVYEGGGTNVGGDFNSPLHPSMWDIEELDPENKASVEPEDAIDVEIQTNEKTNTTIDAAFLD